MSEDEELVEKGVVPEPTGIMGLAAAIKHKDRFLSSDVLLVCFTGHAIKDIDGVSRLIPEVADQLISKATESRPDLVVREQDSQGKVVLVEKDILSDDLECLIREEIERTGFKCLGLL